MKYIVILLTKILLFDCISAQNIETVEAVVGESTELPCNVTAEKEDDKLNILAWYKNDSSTAFYSSRDFRSEQGSVASAGDRYQLVAAEGEGLDKLQIENVRPSDAGLYHCLADFAASPAHKTFVQLVVIEPPQRLWVIHENGTRVATATAGANTSRNIGPYFIGDTVHLFCVVFGGKPQSSLSWWAEQRLLKDSSTPLSEHRVRSDLVYGPLAREDHGRVLTCFAKNNDKTSPLSIDVTIDMYLPPELVSVRDEGSGARVRAGEILSLQCRVLGARPLPPIQWQLNGNELFNLEQNITMEPSQRLVVSEIDLRATREYDEARVACCVPEQRRRAAQLLCSQGLPLTVWYPPALKIVLDEELENNTLTVVKGSNVLLNCTYEANPALYQLIWFYKEDILTRDKNSSDAAIVPILELKEVTENDSGEYVCAGTNDEGFTYSETVNIDVTYPAYCEEETVSEYGLAENESVNVTCNVIANPEPSLYRWVLVNEAANISTLKPSQYRNMIETVEPTLLYQRPNHTTFSTIFCWGINYIPTEGLAHSPCTFLVTDHTAPRAPADCSAVKNALKDITVTCEKGHDGGLPQKFTFIVKSLETDEQLLSITNIVEPKFIIQEPIQDNYKFVIIASNAKGSSKTVEIDKESIVDESTGPEEAKSAVSNITSLALALCGGVALIALAACGLVLCAHERADRRDTPLTSNDPPLCAYNTDESNCETYHDSDDGSDCNVRRTESFRRAMSRYPSKNYDVRRTSSFHSARYMNDVADHEGVSKCNDGLRHSSSCRVHSLQNINRRREMDALCDHLVMHLPSETNYNAPRPMNTFYTMPRKMRHKLAKEHSDEISEITQTSDGFSLPPPPDEFGTYRAGTKIKDMPTKTTPTYTTVVRKNSSGRDTTKQQYNNVIISPMNTVGLPTISGTHNTVYTYPNDDHQGHQDTQRATGILTTFQSIYSPKESGL